MGVKFPSLTPLLSGRRGGKQRKEVAAMAPAATAAVMII